jgi:hypothetical protein
LPDVQISRNPPEFATNDGNIALMAVKHWPLKGIPKLTSPPEYHKTIFGKSKNTKIFPRQENGFIHCSHSEDDVCGPVLISHHR